MRDEYIYICIVKSHNISVFWFYIKKMKKKILAVILKVNTNYSYCILNKHQLGVWSFFFKCVII